MPIEKIRLELNQELESIYKDYVDRGNAIVSRYRDDYGKRKDRLEQEYQIYDEKRRKYLQISGVAEKGPCGSVRSKMDREKNGTVYRSPDDIDKALIITEKMINESNGLLPSVNKKIAGLVYPVYHGYFTNKAYDGLRSIEKYLDDEGFNVDDELKKYEQELMEQMENELVALKNEIVDRMDSIIESKYLLIKSELERSIENAKRNASV